MFDLRLPAGERSAEPSEASRKRAAGWSGQGVQTDVQAIEGPPFWNVADLVDVPELVERTVGAVLRAARERAA